MLTGPPWFRERRERVRDWLSRLTTDAALECGTRYVLYQPGHPPGLTVADLLELDVDAGAAHLPGEAPSQAFAYAVVADPASGERRTVPRVEVLWPCRDHEAVRAAARSLDLTLVPTSIRSGPVWRLGRERLRLTDMVRLGEALVQS